MDVPSILILLFGVCAGATVGFLVGRIGRAKFDRQLRNANTRMRSLELARDQLRDALETARAEIVQLEESLHQAQTRDRELFLVLSQHEGSDLTSIKGIGPKIAAILMTEGIETTQALASLTESDLERLSERWPAVVTRMRRERWRELAAEANGAASIDGRVQSDQKPNHAGRSSPKDVAVEVEEPDAVITPEVEYPTVRFG